MQSAVSDLINHLHDQPAWWYGVHYKANSPHSLCDLLGIVLPDDYPGFLRSMNLVNSRGQIDRIRTEKFAGEMVGIQWQWMKVDGKKHIFICIGEHPNKKNYPTKAEGQFEMHNQKKIFAPKRSSDIAAKKNFLTVWQANKPEKKIVDENDNDIKHKKSAATTKNNNNIPFVVTPAKTQEVGDQKKQSEKDKILDILGRELLSKLFDEEALTNVVAIFRSSLTVDEVLNSVATTHIQVQEERENLLQKKKRALLHATQPKELNVDKSRFPYMLSKGIDVTNSDHISRLLREVSKLQRDVLVSSRDVDIFKFMQHNEKTTTLVRVPTNSTMKHFETNLTSNGSKSRGGYNFVFRILEAMLPQEQKMNDTNDVGMDDEESFNHDRTTVKWTQVDHAAEGLIVYLGKRFGAAFVKGADILGMPVVKKKERMDVSTSAAMCDDAGLSNSQLRVVNKYTMYAFGHPLTATESKMRALGQKAILPICEEAVIKEERCPYFKKDPVEVIEKKLLEAVEPNPSLNWDRLDIILGGDHGQGAFRVPIKLLVKDERHDVKIEFEYNIAEVECKKDTSEVLRGTIFPYLNERLKTMIRYERCPITNEIIGKNDGTIYEYRRVQAGGGASVSRFSFQDDVAVEGEEMVRGRPFTFIVTGDLAFYAVVLGMKNASGFHCHLCRLRKTDWEKHPHQKGTARTMEWLMTAWPKARPTKGGRLCGVIERPLLDAIDPCRFVVPPLHSMLGIANSILNDFKIFIDLLLEDAPPKLKSLRNNEMLAEIALNEKEKEIADWGTLNGPTLAQCHEEKEELMTLQYSMCEVEEGTEEEKSAISDELDEVHERLAALNAERENLVAQKEILSTEWKKKKAKLSAFLKCKNNKKYRKSVKSHFETCLRRFGIDYAAYHGGDLVGNDCRKLMSKAEEIMEEVEVVLQAVAIEKLKGDETKEAISCRCRSIRDALVVFDSVFAIMFKPNAKVEMEKDLPELTQLLEKALMAWSNLKDKNGMGGKNITPKVHGLVQHLADQFEMYNGIGDYDEQFVERNHQTGKRDRKRSCNMRDCGRKYKSIAFWEERRKNVDVIGKTMVVQTSRKRNFKGERKATAQQVSKKQRQIDRKRIVDNIQSRDLSGESARILAMNELKEYNPPEEEIDYDGVEDGRGGGGMMEDDDSDDDNDGVDAVGAEDI